MSLNADIIFALDYELFFGKNTGTAKNCLITPTDELIKTTDKYGIKYTFFVDSGYLLNLKNSTSNKLQIEYTLIARHLSSLSKNGHDIQLHIHPHWEESVYSNNDWSINYNKFKLHSFSDEEIHIIVKNYKEILEDIAEKEIVAYRAGGWCIQPFSKIKNALAKENVYVDSTVYNNGFSQDKVVGYNFQGAPNKDFWRFSDDPIIEDVNGNFLEIPISSIEVSPLFFWKMGLLKKINKGNYKTFSDGEPIKQDKGYYFDKLFSYTNSVVSIDGMKASLLQNSFNKLIHKDKHKIFNVIGHPKALTRNSLQMLDCFLSSNKNNNFETIDSLQEKISNQFAYTINKPHYLK